MIEASCAHLQSARSIKVDFAAEVEAFVARDPYVKNGVVTRHRIRPWNVVVGA